MRTAKPEIFKREPWASTLSSAQVEEICRQRAQKLDALRSFISLAHYNRLEEKLRRERREFQILLDVDESRKRFLAQYSHVLNPSYFEQKLWPVQPKA